MLERTNCWINRLFTVFFKVLPCAKIQAPRFQVFYEGYRVTAPPPVYKGSEKTKKERTKWNFFGGWRGRPTLYLVHLLGGRKSKFSKVSRVRARKKKIEECHPSGYVGMNIYLALLCSSISLEYMSILMHMISPE